MAGKNVIAIVLDRSASMHECAYAVCDGLNQFVAGQDKDNTLFTLVQFNTTFQPIYNNVDVKQYEPRLAFKNYVPNGDTALLDAIGTTIQSLSGHIDNLPEDEKPGKVVVAIVTDGRENRSQKFGKKDIATLLSEKEFFNRWEIVFIGANQDAISAGTGYGLKADKSLTYNVRSTDKMFKVLTENVAGYMKGDRPIEFTATQRSGVI